MNINWKLRLKNKAVLTAIFSAIVLCVYNIAAALGVDFGVSQEQVNGVIATALTLLTALGVIVDPTTQGISDSTAALEYEEPKSE